MQKEILWVKIERRKWWLHINEQSPLKIKIIEKTTSNKCCIVKGYKGLQNESYIVNQSTIFCVASNLVNWMGNHKEKHWHVIFVDLQSFHLEKQYCKGKVGQSQSCCTIFLKNFQCKNIHLNCDLTYKP